jgi:hypothetical protein
MPRSYFKLKKKGMNREKPKVIISAGDIMSGLNLNLQRNRCSAFNQHRRLLVLQRKK